MTKDEKNLLKQRVIALSWVLYFIYRMVYGNSLANSYYYEGVIYEIHEGGFTIDTKIEPSEKNTQFQRVFHFENTSDREFVKSKIKVGDSFKLHYRGRGVEVMQMSVNGNVIIKYNWWKWNWLTFIFASVMFLTLVGPPIWMELHVKNKFGYIMYKRYEKFVIDKLLWDDYLPDFDFFSNNTPHYILYEFHGARYLHVLNKDKTLYLWKYGIDEISPDNAFDKTYHWNETYSLLMYDRLARQQDGEGRLDIIEILEDFPDLKEEVQARRCDAKELFKEMSQQISEDNEKERLAGPPKETKEEHEAKLRKAYGMYITGAMPLELVALRMKLDVKELTDYIAGNHNVTK